LRNWFFFLLRIRFLEFSFFVIRWFSFLLTFLFSPSITFFLCFLFLNFGF
jgi:hypothetical protein